jgi:hypothetical protein
VAAKLGYKLGQNITLTHGSGALNLPEHADKPFRVVGILQRTGTPVDRTVHVNLAAIEAIHLDWQGGAPLPGFSIPAQYVKKFDLTPKQITATLVGLKSRGGVFRMQRFVNNYRDEPLVAVLPGVALDQLWQLLAVAEQTLRVISLLVLATGFCGMIAVVLASLNERRRELAILRSVGAGAGTVLGLLMAEGSLLLLAGCVLGAGSLWLACVAAAPWLEAQFVRRELAFQRARHARRHAGRARSSQGRTRRLAPPSDSGTMASIRCGPGCDNAYSSAFTKASAVSARAACTPMPCARRAKSRRGPLMSSCERAFAPMRSAPTRSSSTLSTE